ncbi:MAG: hypothetical protein GPW16_00060 [Euryarchaeota archaeon]|nr:hypothetical protein [Euryarchaeota archaeon]
MKMINSMRTVFGFNVCKDDIMKNLDMRYPRPLHISVNNVIKSLKRQ